MRLGVSFIVQSTEDEEKILSSVIKTLSIDGGRERLSSAKLQGHYKNPLTYIEISLKRGEPSKVFKRVMEGLDPGDRERLLENIQDYMDDKRRLYLRLDKQDICLGRISLSQRDAVRIVLRISKRELEELLRRD